ncbi:beta-galactosidase [Clostridium novyi A str. 4552]|uniref:Beta-galactosidase n=1 Tax=Clostridium novyi A str. 4552 TaxID=1444289 RepID=A0A0A0IEG1_CLONO|nr:beta-galactosidase [Clostridium novyi]KGM98000.1 beta-galactosidase [Clostridium novyi A str. 4552]
MYLGVDYYPEHWDYNLINDDLKKMKSIGVNVIRIGEFAWHLIEKEEGKYDFSFFDSVIEKAKRFNIKVIFGTPTATFPAWLCKKYPSILSKDENLQVRVFGGRRQYCFNSEKYMEYSVKMIEKLVSHYKNEKNIVCWQVDNEFGHEGSDMCYCEQCHENFKDFLSKKYKSIEKLNHIYGTIFWGQTYNDFFEIPIPIKTITTHNPTLQLDWARFRSISLSKFANKHIEIIRRLKGEHQSITTNIPGGFFDKYYDHEKITEKLDFVSYDNYPVWGGLKEPMPSEEIAMNLDFIRGLKMKNFCIMEQLIGAQGHTVIGYLPRPNQAKMWSYQAFAHGCENMLWFRWREMNKGAEQFCFGVIDSNNKMGRKCDELKSTIEELNSYEKVFKSNINSSIAIIYDYDNIWSWRFQPQSYEFDFKKEVIRMYRPFYKNNINIDVISSTRSFKNYKIIVIPVMQIVDDKMCEKLDEFCKNGGTIIFSYRAGIKDRNNNLYFNNDITNRINKILGLEVTEVESLQLGQEVLIKGNGKYDDYGKCAVWRDIIDVTTANILYKYEDKFYSNKACITLNKYLNGKVYYIGGGVDDNILSNVVDDILVESNIDKTSSQNGLEVYPRSYDNKKYYVITNHTEEEKSFNGEVFKPYESKVLNLN